MYVSESFYGVIERLVSLNSILFHQSLIGITDPLTTYLHLDGPHKAGFKNLQYAIHFFIFSRIGMSIVCLIESINVFTNSSFQCSSPALLRTALPPLNIQWLRREELYESHPSHELYHGLVNRLTVDIAISRHWATAKVQRFHFQLAKLFRGTRNDKLVPNP